MHYHRRPSWWLPESAATPEHIYWNRRAFIAAGATAVGAAAVGVAGLGAAPALADTAGQPFDPKPPLNPDFANAGRPVTPEDITGEYNNFYEFASHKQIYRAAQALPTDGWTITIDGMVEKETTVSVDDLLKLAPLEERVIRHRCVEAWSMVVPWVGFTLADVLGMAKPLGSAKFVRFESFMKPEVAPGQAVNRFYPWPYIEGLTIKEAANPLAFMVVGAYGKVLPKQYGAPIRLHLPWKYGFKSNKSIVKITLTEERPVSFWEQLQSSEYGFWANVNPEVSHPRWSQASERDIGTNERIPTQLFNGYADAVGDLYAGMEDLGDALYR